MKSNKGFMMAEVIVVSAIVMVAFQEIGVFRHVAQPTRLRLDFPRETGLILRCAKCKRENVLIDTFVPIRLILMLSCF